jgi:hypothetical protein
VNRLVHLVLALLPLLGAAPAATFYGVADPVMAEYDGFWTSASGAKGRVIAQIRPLENNRYDGFVLFMRARTPVGAFTLQPALLENSVLSFTGAAARKESGGDLLARSEAKCELRDGKLTGTFSGELGKGTFEAGKAERHSPSLGSKAPKNAIVILNANSPSVAAPNKWTITADGAMRIGDGNFTTQQQLSSFQLHLEFRTPYMPAFKGQERGNSGIYLQGKYEVQVLDSFGLYPLEDNDCGGIYRVRAPAGNACLPPMAWQTFDITYVQPSPGANQGGAPMITVVQNGVTVIDHVKIPSNLVAPGTGGGDSSGGFLMLQNHGNAVEFRNIWAKPIFATGKKR